MSGSRVEERLFLENLSVRIARSCMQQKSAQITFFFKQKGRQFRLVQKLKETIRDQSSFYLPALLPSAGGSHPHSHKVTASLPKISPIFLAEMKVKARRKKYVPAKFLHPFLWGRQEIPRKFYPNLYSHLVSQTWVRRSPLAARAYGEVVFIGHILFKPSWGSVIK